MRFGVAFESRALGDAGKAAVSGAVDPPGENAREVGALHVIQVEHGVLQARRLEQPPLGAGIALHVAVVVEVITREVGKQRCPERDAVDASLIEADRGDFHRHTLGALGQQSRERAVKKNRVGSGVDAGVELPGKPGAERAHHRGPRPAGTARLREPLAA